MAYLHCHSCDWEQDDFWNWKWTWKIWKERPFGYNPISLMIDYVRRYMKPRYIEFDSHFAESIGFKSNRIHSWRFMLHEFNRNFRRVRKMKWWTEDSWYKSREDAVCPGCGDKNFDID
jgi:hypothetical protein